MGRFVVIIIYLVCQLRDIVPCQEHDMIPYVVSWNRCMMMCRGRIYCYLHVGVYTCIALSRDVEVSLFVLWEPIHPSYEENESILSCVDEQKISMSSARFLPKTFCLRHEWENVRFWMWTYLFFRLRSPRDWRMCLCRRNQRQQATREIEDLPLQAKKAIRSSVICCRYTLLKSLFGKIK